MSDFHFITPLFGSGCCVSFCQVWKVPLMGQSRHPAPSRTGKRRMLESITVKTGLFHLFCFCVKTTENKPSTQAPNASGGRSMFSSYCSKLQIKRRLKAQSVRTVVSIILFLQQQEGSSQRKVKLEGCIREQKNSCEVKYCLSLMYLQMALLSKTFRGRLHVKGFRSRTLNYYTFREIHMSQL